MEKKSNQQIPIYYFEPETGLYCGEYVAQYIDGKPAVPPDATIKAPTPAPPNYVNVWDTHKKQWTHEKREKYKLSNYEHIEGMYQRQDNKTFTTCSIFPTNPYLTLADTNFQALSSFYNKLTGFERYIASLGSATLMYNRLVFLNNKIISLYKDYQSLFEKIANEKTPNFPLNPTLQFNLRYEEIIYQMKRILDVFVMIAHIGEKLQGKLADSSFTIQMESIGDLLFPKKTYAIKNVRKIMAFDHYADFYYFLNTLHNCWKHEILCESNSMNLFVQPFILISKKQKRSSLETVISYSCPFDFIVHTFRDVLSEVILLTPQNSTFNLYKNKKLISYSEI